ncbi:MAG: 30S ribosomal protein S2 [Candidatus Portnoybacteria bacterium RIFCSPLOWO2_12_FULL_39_9]|uniref:Small ribosomal subunit protein uS2 n=1 Tax=Candidatus Portnoybacteria bacterium RIFCSPHIGHO2_12_FULL_38_9 TaxID=1801997 RepID=A0A1G2FF75_9BACT|nr:MAG: 30S ribosomal protein S2 [Candidatus Portnoybacteria bacterium RBG_13_40_8]OGZ36258.1 MAG: 30S ribosomal protein S2 [Candidatus Portnoybacteria bacterium RIFCSPHIGHO2_12_FULL_38_9]OGZ36947.1 MAG: 30S ribosomal protein S2 [Candidatus Portnoybacteria bacterium RIFCSPHIGHO2_02_FULL_39_12]OGZ37995.1 MAG: 30S ribosomal protein S2 [Candidatus Portnoybacteria bacterium RIFCSPLOWO2_01_FULL_38_39]OGZ40076.1 MAG: 30S ribosomal protein S2 [Candidatus Portnoybacteria bacterium RIFCSPLOWO2_12_FULL_3
MEIPTLEEMMKAGVHFGHRTSRWNPKMEPYIFTTRNNVHIIDLEKTYEKLKEALEFLKELKDKKGIALFVGTKISAKKIVEEAAKECGMPYVNERWLGGTLTNFNVISKRLEYFRNLEKKQKSGELEKYTKKERHEFGIELRKSNHTFGGIKEMVKLPDVLFIVDIREDYLAAKEAKMKGIPSVGLCDTNTDPTSVNFPIPSNDDASSALKLMVGAVAGVLK